MRGLPYLRHELFNSGHGLPYLEVCSLACVDQRHWVACLVLMNLLALLLSRRQIRLSIRSPLVGKKRSVLNGDYDLDFHPSGTSISKVLCCWNTNECLGFDIPERIKNLILQHV